MRKFIKVLSVLAILFVAIVSKSNAQQCNLQGVVKYKYNDYIGYEIDDGAEIYIISVSSVPNINFQAWEKYQELAKDYMHFLDFKNEFGITYARTFCLSEAEEKVLDSLELKCFSESIYIKTNAEFIALVDGTGKYSLQLPFGEYYILAKSNNRKRPIIMELDGRIILKKETIDKPNKILSFEFDY